LLANQVMREVLAFTFQLSFTVGGSAYTVSNTAVTATKSAISRAC
jgi:hypothetical protein